MYAFDVYPTYFIKCSSLPVTFLHGSSVCVKMPTAACIIMKTIQSFNALSTQKNIYRYTLSFIMQLFWFEEREI